MDLFSGTTLDSSYEWRSQVSDSDVQCQRDCVSEILSSKKGKLHSDILYENLNDTILRIVSLKFS